MTGLTLLTNARTWEGCNPKPEIHSAQQHTSTLVGRSWEAGSGPDFACHGDRGHTADPAAGAVPHRTPPHPTSDSWGSLARQKQTVGGGWEMELMRKPCKHIRGSYAASTSLGKRLLVKLLWTLLSLSRSDDLQ